MTENTQKKIDDIVLDVTLWAICTVMLKTVGDVHSLVWQVVGIIAIVLYACLTIDIMVSMVMVVVSLLNDHVQKKDEQNKQVAQVITKLVKDPIPPPMEVKSKMTMEKRKLLFVIHGCLGCKSNEMPGNMNPCNVCEKGDCYEPQA